MTHDKKILNNLGSFSPVSLENAEPTTKLEITLEKVVPSEGIANLSALLEEIGARTQNEKVVSSTATNTLPYIWAFGLMHATPRV